MKYVLDSSVAIKWVLPETDSDRADRLRDGYRQAVHELLAPSVFTTEVAHALTRAERQRRIPQGRAIVFWTDMMRTCPTLLPSDPLLPRAIDISSQARVGIYDCLYVALAERQGCELVTADARLIGNLRPRFPFLVPLSSLP